MAYFIVPLLSILGLLLQTPRTNEFLDQDGDDHPLNPAAQIVGNEMRFATPLYSLSDSDLAPWHLLIRVFSPSLQFGQQKVDAFLQGIARPQLLFIPENDPRFIAQPLDLFLKCFYFLQKGLQPKQRLHTGSQLCLLLEEV